MDQDLILHGGDDECRLFPKTPLPQLTGVPVEGTYEVSLNQGAQPEETFSYEYDPSASPAQARDYLFAAASGVLMGAINVLWQKDFNLADARAWGSEKVEGFVISTAKRVGLSKEGATIEDAIRYLEKTFPFAGDKLTAQFGGGLQHHLRDFSHHPSPVGLVCSLIMQFTGKGVGTATDGSFAMFDLPASVVGGEPPLIGRNLEEKILFGTVNWVLHLISDMAGSSATPGAGTGIPGPILSFLKEVSALPFFQDMSIGRDGKFRTFSQWISKAFNGTLFTDDAGDPLRFDLRTEIGLLGQALTQAPSVLANECIVRGFYTVTRLVDELKRCNVSSVKDIARVNPSRFLPVNSRALARMLTVASGSFVAVNASLAAVRAATEGMATDGAGFVSLFFMRLNYVGVARFAFALWADRSYIYEDVTQAWERYCHDSVGTDVAVSAPAGEEAQRVLDSLILAWCEDDCQRTKKTEHRERKEQLTSAWKRSRCLAYDENRGDYFRDPASAYRELRAIREGENGAIRCLYIAQVLRSFDPYRMEKKLSFSVDWRDKAFVNEQDVIDATMLTRLGRAEASYERVLSGAVSKRAVVGTGVVATTIAMGGIAWFAAPLIAPFLAGEAVAGLSGAALTSASLAWVGGGSLAAGGLGMAGGVAIITGGGAALGLATASGSAALAGTLAKDHAQRVKTDCVGALSQCSLLVEMEPGDALRCISELRAFLERRKASDQRAIDSLKDKKDRESKGSVKRLDKGTSHIDKTIKELGSLEEKARETAVKNGVLRPDSGSELVRAGRTETR